MKIYLACPYSHRIEAIRIERFEYANKAAAGLMKDGHIVFSPISHSHSIAVQNNLPLDFDFWEKFDISFIEWCDCILILQINGWDKSEGIKKEIEIAKQLNKPVYYIEVVKKGQKPMQSPCKKCANRRIDKKYCADKCDKIKEFQDKYGGYDYNINPWHTGEYSGKWSEKSLK